MKTKSEAIFETFLSVNDLPFQKIEEETSPRPDYLVSIGPLKVFFEVKELSKDKNFGVVDDPAYPNIQSHSRTVGDHVRHRIASSKKQIQYGSDQGVPSVLLIYNLMDPVFQTFGTESMDFITAMYGAYTILLRPQTGVASETFNGEGQMLQEEKNTSFSAVGHLCDRGRLVTVTLFENLYAKVPIPYEHLPVCFNVHRARLSTEPLSWA